MDGIEGLIGIYDRKLIFIIRVVYYLVLVLSSYGVNSTA